MKTLRIALAAAAFGWFGATLAPAASGPEPAGAVQQAESPAGQDLTEPEGEDERSFRLSTDPEGIVLRAEYFNQVGDETAVFTLYGDGRLTHEHGNKTTEALHNRVEMQLDAGEGERLVRSVVDGGLLECGPDCFDARCVPEDPSRRPRPICPGVELTLNLEAYKAPGELAPRRVQRHMVHACPEAVMASCHEIAEPYALDWLQRRLFRYRRTMTERTPPQLGEQSPDQARGAAASTAEGERSFTLSTDPETVVLRHSKRGGTYTLYGDGRLVYEPGRQVTRRSSRIEIQLDYVELESLIRKVVDAGLLECGADCIQTRCAQLRGINRIGRTTDCGSTTLTLNLESYQGPKDTSSRPVQGQLHLHCPRSLVTAWCTEQELPEVQGLRDLGRALYDRRIAAEEVAQ